MSGFIQSGMGKTVNNRHPIEAQLKVFKYPMNSDTNAPKIPDGKAMLSAGLKLQQTTELMQVDELGHLLMFPGISNGLVFKGMQHTSATAPTGNMMYNGHGVIVNVVPQGGANLPTETDAVSDERAWRVVSQQVKFTCINGADDYDGWWECVRIPTLTRTHRLATVERTKFNDVPNNVEVNSIAPGIDPAAPNQVYPAIPIDSPLVNNVTYCTGKIKDLHRYNFQLLPSLNDNDFVDLGGDTLTKDILDSLIDTSFDSWYMRFHGTKATFVTAEQAAANNGDLKVGDIVRNASTPEPTTIMVHLVSNQELIYDENSYNSRYHTECYDAFSKLDAVKKNMHQYTKAARPMFGGGV